jgi:hypothetical protein
LPTFSTQQKGFKPKGLKFVVNGGNLNKQGVQIESSATLLIIRGLVFVNWVNATTKGAGVMKLVPLTGNSKITLDCTYLSNKI